jgi:hypothetical protein
MNEPTSIMHLDEAGVMRVGKGRVRLDDIVDAYSKKHPLDAILARFPSLTELELKAALDHHLADETGGVPRGPHQRDADWRRWNATLAEDLATDTPPNAPTANNDGSK